MVSLKFYVILYRSYILRSSGLAWPLQERMEREKAELEAAADEEEGQERGEEEERTEDECVEETGACSMYSAAHTIRPAPQMASVLGSLAVVASPKKKPQQKKRKKNEGEGEQAKDGETMEVDAGECTDPDVLADPLLKMMVDSLGGQCPACFTGLVPSTVLLNFIKIGKQLRGAGSCEKLCN